MCWRTLSFFATLINSVGIFTITITLPSSSHIKMHFRLFDHVQRRVAVKHLSFSNELRAARVQPSPRQQRACSYGGDP